MGLKQYLVDHKTLSTCYHVEHHVDFCVFSNFYGPSGLKA